MREQHEADGLHLSHLAEEREALSQHNRLLNHQLNEAILHEKPALATALLSDDVVQSLCLRYHAASGLFPAASAGAVGAGRADPRAGNTAAKLPAACAAWQGRLTVGALIEWSGALLDHAGAERLDKAALRARNERIKAMGEY